MTDMNSLHDHYIVISGAGEVHASCLVIADCSADAAETHREHYPGRAIIRVIGRQGSLEPTA
jgi:hypothetical protein